MADEEPTHSKFQKWLDEELEASRGQLDDGPPTAEVFSYEEEEEEEEQAEEEEEEEEEEPAAPPAEPPELICSPVTEPDAGSACLRLYHGGECGEWCRNPPWPLRACLPTASDSSPERHTEQLTGVAAKQKAGAMENLREVRLKKVGRRKILSTLYDLLAPNPDIGIDIDEFAEYLTFVEPNTEVDRDIVHTQLRKVRLDVDAKNVDFDTFEAFVYEIEPVLPPSLVAQLFPTSARG